MAVAGGTARVASSVAGIGAALSIYRRLIAVQVRSQLQYRGSFWFELFATVVTAVAEFASLVLVFGTFSSLGGWPLREIAFLYGLAEAAFGTMDLVFGGFDPSAFGLHVRRGSLDQMLLRPVPVTIQVLGSQFPIRRLGRAAQGAVILAVALAINDVQWTAAKLVYLPMVLASLVAFFGGLFMFGAAVTFWTIESIEVVNILTYGGTTMISYPMTIYPVWMRRFFTFVVPAIFLAYFPALFFLDKPLPAGVPHAVEFLAPAAGIGLFAVAFACWRYAIRHYQSTGT